jgi:hypothetical protein
MIEQKTSNLICNNLSEIHYDVIEINIFKGLRKVVGIQNFPLKFWCTALKRFANPVLLRTLLRFLSLCMLSQMKMILSDDFLAK